MSEKLQKSPILFCVCQLCTCALVTRKSSAWVQMLKLELALKLLPSPPIFLLHPSIPSKHPSTPGKATPLLPTLQIPWSLSRSQSSPHPFTSSLSTYCRKLTIQLSQSLRRASSADVSCAVLLSALELDSRKERRASGAEGSGVRGLREGGRGFNLPTPHTLSLSCHPSTPPDLKTRHKTRKQVCKYY